MPVMNITISASDTTETIEEKYDIEFADDIVALARDLKSNFEHNTTNCLYVVTYKNTVTKKPAASHAKYVTDVLNGGMNVKHIRKVLDKKIIKFGQLSESQKHAMRSLASKKSAKTRKK